MINNKSNKRIASYELLRVIAMYMVVIAHFNTHSGTLMYPGDPITPAGIMAGALESVAIISLNTYGLITGYFMCEAGYRVRRIVNLWLQIAFYTTLIPVALTALAIPVKGQEGIWQIAKYVMPISMRHYWFATVYFILYLMMPILNKAVHALSRRQMKTIIIGLLLFTCVIKTLSPVELMTDNYGYDTLWFTVLYLIAAYIRLYDIPRFNHPFKAAGTFVISCAIMFVTHMVLHAYNLKTGALEFYAGVPFHHNYIFTLTAAIGLFYLFRFVHIREGLPAELVRAVAPYTFGVYLIHEHIDIRDRWVSGLCILFGTSIATNPILYALQTLAYCAVLYILCILIEMLRATIFRIIGRRLKGCWIDRKIDEIDALFK